jgi:hypothetical protein
MVQMCNPEVRLLTSDYVYDNTALWFKNINVGIVLFFEVVIMTIWK